MKRCGVASSSGNAEEEVKHVVAAGGIISKKDGAQISIIIVERADSGKWAPIRRQLPKGGCEPGESLQTTAIREVQEETGFRVKILEEAGKTSWIFERDGIKFQKSTSYFLMNPVSLEPGAHDSEYENVRWIKLEEAIDTLSYPEERELVRELSVRLPNIESLEG